MGYGVMEFCANQSIGAPIATPLHLPINAVLHHPTPALRASALGVSLHSTVIHHIPAADPSIARRRFAPPPARNRPPRRAVSGLIPLKLLPRQPFRPSEKEV